MNKNALRVIQDAKYAMVYGNTAEEPVPIKTVEYWLTEIEHEILVEDDLDIKPWISFIIIIGFVSQIALIVLKSLGMINWNWFVVLFPIELVLFLILSVGLYLGFSFIHFMLTYDYDSRPDNVHMCTLKDADE